MRYRFFALAFLFAACPALAHAATVEVSGWIPYWRAGVGSADVTPHLAQLSTVMPFGYIVQNNGSIYDAFGLNAPNATTTALLRAAKAQKVRVVPTFMWSNGEAIHTILSSSSKRRALADRIVALAKRHNFDGVDIDFEGKYAKTRPYFSLFLERLNERLGSKKWLSCTIEARTPPEAAFDVIPETIERANDFKAINKYCDRVNLMTYDQGTIDLRLNSAAAGAPYIPVSDPAWVAKVVNVASQDISKRKLMIGVPTYGYEYTVTPLSISGYRYDLLWAFNPRYATDLAAYRGITPTRNSAGELSFTYTATTTPPTTRIAWWSDAEAVRQKIELAKSLGVRGVAIFKLDAGQDPNMWNVLPVRR